MEGGKGWKGNGEGAVRCDRLQEFDLMPGDCCDICMSRMAVSSICWCRCLLLLFAVGLNAAAQYLQMAKLGGCVPGCCCGLGGIP